jgi:inorganic pyrophosphatase
MNELAFGCAVKTVSVFIQNEAGSCLKHYHDEKTLAWQRTVTVSCAYPFPYGFVIGTTAEDGCNIDCFVVTSTALKTGEVVQCEVIGLMEQFEDGTIDHNVLARLPGESTVVTEAIERALAAFVAHVFDHIEGKQIGVGQFLGPNDAEVHIANRTDR